MSKIMAALEYKNEELHNPLLTDEKLPLGDHENQLDTTPETVAAETNLLMRYLRAICRLEPGLLRDNLSNAFKKLLFVISSQARMRFLGICGAKINPLAGAVIGEAIGPAFSMASTIPLTLKQTLLADIKKGAAIPGSDEQKKLLALYHFTIISSMIFTIPAALLVMFMPEIYHALGNRALVKVGIDCRILGAVPLATALMASSGLFTDALSKKRQSNHPLFSVLSQDIPMIIMAIIGWKLDSFLIIALGQLFFGCLGSYFSYRNIINGLKESGWKKEEAISLTCKEKKHYLCLMLQGLPAAIGDAVVREVFIFLLGHKKDPEASLSFYFMLYQIFFTTYAFVKILANSISYGGNLPEYEAPNHRNANEGGTMALTTAVSFIFGMIILGVKDPLILFLNEPKNHDAIRANEMMSEWYLFLVAAICLQGPALTQMEKIQNVLKKRLLAGFLDNMPQLLLLAASVIFPLASETMVIGLLASWVFGDILNIAVGAFLPSHLPPRPQVAAILYDPSTHNGLEMDRLFPNPPATASS